MDNPDLWPAVLGTFGLFLLVGFLAQLIDGAVGMAYGVISSSVLLAFGVPPAQASATIHAAECFTTGASGASHIAHRNIDWRLFMRLAPAGVVGGVIGAYLLTGFDPTFIKAVVIAYLGVLGIFMLARAIRGPKEEDPHLKHVVPLGVVGGFLDASGGGGWGPIVSSTLLGRGHPPRYVIG
ncbi:MAG: sulfite exporter TauE/SafE family protein, partial [Vitreimonas sp.]